MKKILHIVLFLTVVFTYAFSQTHFEHFSVSDGLSNSSVKSIIQDNNGFLWFGTLNGLNRYDGFNIEVFKQQPGNLNSLANSRVVDIYEDAHHYLWILTFDNNIHRYDPRTDSFLNIRKLITNYGNTRISIALTETGKGTIWMKLTSGGLIRFEGSAEPDYYRITIFDTTNILPGNHVHFIHEDKMNRVWIGTDKGMVAMANDSIPVGSTDHIVFFGNDDPMNFSNACETANKLWFGTANNGMIVYSFSDSSFTRLVFDEKTDSRIIGIREGISNDILIVTAKNGAFYYSDEGSDHIHLDSDEGFILDLDRLDFIKVYCDNFGKFWIINRHRGITLFDPETRMFTYFGLNSEKRESPGEDDKHIFFEDSNNDLWVGIYGGGLFKYNRKNKYFDHFFNDENDKNSLSSNFVLSIFEDHSNNLWIGTFQGGLNKMGLFRYDFQYHQPVRNSVLHTENEVRSMIEDSFGRLWIGTKDGHVYCLNKQNEKIFRIPEDIPSWIYGKANVYALLEDRGGSLWVGTKGNGVFRINGLLKKERFSKNDYRIDHIVASQNGDKISGLSDNDIYSLLQDNHGQIWIGSYNGGLNLIQSPDENLDIVHFLNNEDIKSSLIDNRVRFLFQDDEHRLWIATSHGISMLEEKYFKSFVKTFKNFNSRQSDINTLSNNDVVCIYQDKYRNIWAGTYGGGLNLIHETENGNFWFEHFTMEHGFSSDVILSIQEDDEGNLWLGTDNGLCKFLSDRSNSINFVKDEGHGEEIFSEGCGLKTSAGKLVFGQKNGFVEFYPEEITIRRKQYPVVITNFKISNRVIEPGMKNSPLSRSIEYIDEISLKYNQNSFEFEYSTLDYVHPERCQFAYILEGFGEDWNYVGKKRIATYTNIDPGEYTFRLKATNNYGYWNSDEKVLHLIITPPFWKTIWFRVILVLMIIMLITGLYYYRLNNYLRKQREYLIRTVKERTREVEQKNEQLMEQTNVLNETNTQLEERQQYIEEQAEELTCQTEHLEDMNQKLDEMNKTKDRFFSIIAHDLKNPFNSILGFSELMIHKYDKLDDDKRKYYLDIIFKSARNIYQLLENLLEWARSQTDNHSFNPVNFKLREVIDDIIELSDNQIQEKGIDVKVDIPEDLKVFADRNMINTVIRNLFTNGLKFTNKGNISIYSTLYNRSVKVSISDTGTGIAEDRLKGLFDIDKKQSTTGTKGEAGTGLGLLICKELIEKHGGVIEVNSKVGEGSTFSFSLSSDKK